MESVLLIFEGFSFGVACCSVILILVCVAFDFYHHILFIVFRLSILVVVTNPLLVVMFPFSFFIPTLICWTWAEGPPKTASLLLQGRDRPWKRAIFSYQSSPFSDEKSKVQLRCDCYECMFSVSDFGKSNLNPLLKSASDQRRTMRFSTSLFSCVSILILVLKSISFTNANTMDVKVLRVGQELMKETLPLQSGSRLYELQGLNSNRWYEVKISYPASIPATFTLQLSKGSSGLNVGRKLLNTEKIIFQGNNLQLLRDKGGTFVLVNVEPEGIVSIPGVKERKHIIYNIVCDELLFGIPHQAWYVVVLVVVCLALALVIPSFLPLYLLPRSQGLNAANHGISKES